MAQSVYTLQSTSFWETYAKGRPRVPESFWLRVFDYHASYGGQLNVVNDLGSGVGVHSPALGSRFEHVILTDPGPENLEIAREHLSQHTSEGKLQDSSDRLRPAAKYSYVLGTAENNTIPPASLDMVFSSNVMHHTDPPAALSLIASQLKPGGSVIIPLFGMPIFRSERVQEVWNRMCYHAIGGLREHYKDSPETPIARIIEIQDSGYDSITMPEEWFEDVKRVKLNTAGVSEPFRMAQGEKQQYPFVSNIGPTDELIEEQDEDWAFVKDLEGVRTLFGTFPFPSLDEILMKSLWEEMEKAGDEGRYKGHWVVTTIMAKKRAGSVNKTTMEA